MAERLQQIISSTEKDSSISFDEPEEKINVSYSEMEDARPELERDFGFIDIMNGNPDSPIEN